jgi:hypothetical protein
LLTIPELYQIVETMGMKVAYECVWDEEDRLGKEAAIPLHYEMWRMALVDGNALSAKADSFLRG